MFENGLCVLYFLKGWMDPKAQVGDTCFLSKIALFLDLHSNITDWCSNVTDLCSNAADPDKVGF